MVYSTGCKKCEYSGNGVKEDIDTNDVIYWKSVFLPVTLDYSAVLNIDINTSDATDKIGDINIMKSDTTVITGGVTCTSISKDTTGKNSDTNIMKIDTTIVAGGIIWISISKDATSINGDFNITKSNTRVVNSGFP